MIKSLFGGLSGNRDKSPRRRFAEEPHDSDNNNDDQDDSENPREERRKKRQKYQQDEREDGASEDASDDEEKEHFYEEEADKDEERKDVGEEKERAEEVENSLSSRSSKVEKEIPATPDEEDEPDHPYVGKRVRIIHGPRKGTTGKLVSLKSRGWWTLEGIEGVVHSRRCMLLDKVQEEDMIAYYEKRGKKFRGTPVLDKSVKRAERPRRATNGGANKTFTPAAVMTEGGAAHRTIQALDSENRAPGDDDDAAADIDSVGEDPEGTNLEAPLLMSDLVEAASELPADTICCNDDKHLNAATSVAEPWVLPAVVLEPEGNGIPKALKYLDPTDLLEVFDRKTGKILMGNQRIAVQDLSAELRMHPEYEPIVAPREGSNKDGDKLVGDTTTIRHGRSGTNLYVNASVRPQPKRRWHGKEVVVTSGSYKGKEGRIQSSLPGGWYLVEGILDGIAIVISPDKFKYKTAEGLQGNGTGHQVGKNGNDAEKLASLRTTFSEALGATIQDNYSLTQAQIIALREDQLNLEHQLKEIPVDRHDEGGAASTHRRRLQKRLDYLKNCIEKAQEAKEVDEESAKLAGISVENAFDDAEDEDMIGTAPTSATEPTATSTSVFENAIEPELAK